MEVGYDINEKGINHIQLTALPSNGLSPFREVSSPRPARSLVSAYETLGMPRRTNITTS